MNFTHGIIVNGEPLKKIPIKSNSSIQVAIGLAPAHLAQTPVKAGEPVLINDITEAKEKLGYNEDFLNYPLCQTMYMSFEKAGIAPVVFINVLDTTKHVKDVAEKDVPISNGVGMITDKDVIIGSIVLKDSTVTFKIDVDYTLEKTEQGIKITAIQGGKITALKTTVKATFKVIDLTKVVNEDYVTAISNIKNVFPKTGVVPGILSAPGISAEKEVAQVLIKSTEKINELFGAFAVVDLPPQLKTAKELKQTMEQNGIESRKCAVCYPLSQTDKGVVNMSAVLSAYMSKLDAENEGVPYKSPSNIKVDITGLVTKTTGGTFEEYISEHEKMNELNSVGICTALNFKEWRLWGNRTSSFMHDGDENQTSVQTFISVGRMFDYVGNGFIINYFDLVDNPMNKRLIESIVDSENMRLNGFVANGYLASGHIDFSSEDNPAESLQQGILKVRTSLAPYTPAETIINNLVYDTSALKQALS